MDENDWQLLARYLAGEAAPEDEREVRRRLQSTPEQARFIESLRTLWNLSGTGAPPHGGNARRVWKRIQARALEDSPEAAPPRRAADVLPIRQAAQRPPRFRRLVPLLAAALVLLALIPLLWGADLPLFPRSPLPGATREYAAGKGERLRLTLGDGSVVEIGADSRLRVPVPFGGDLREVRLDGVAFFDVAHDSRRPFVVHARGAVTRVLGTRFVVRAYRGEDAVRVGVVDGRVAVRPAAAAGDAGTLLSRGQLGRLDGDGMVSVGQDRAELARLVGWTSGRLEFRNQPFREVLAELEHWYDVELRVADAGLGAQPLTTVVQGDRIADLLDVVSLVLGARYERSGDTITFHAH